MQLLITILYFLICPFEFVNYDFPNIGDQLEKKKKTYESCNYTCKFDIKSWQKNFK